MQILEAKWDEERNGIFEPMPFKGDENMLVDAKDRAALDEEEGENQLLIGFDNSTPAAATNGGAAAGGGGLLDLDMMLGSSSEPSSTPVSIPAGGDMMDLFGGGGGSAQMPSSGANDLMGQP